MNTLSIRSPEQVMIKVRVVEMQRNLIKQLGFNTQALLGRAGMAQFNFATAAQYAVNNGLLGGLNSGYSLDTTQQPQLQIPCSDPSLNNCHAVITKYNTPNEQTATTQTTSGSPGVNKANAAIQAFERAGLVRSLAEPNLTAVSGESAKFLAGGEFPVPGGVDQNGNVIVTFKSFGVGLGFTPVVLSGGRISLKISTEVSELSTDGELKFNQSLTIPGLTVRRAETTVEMPSGGALMIAGLIKEQTQEDIDRVPGLGSVPVLGSLFRSRDYLSGETELVVIVETYLAKPGSPDQFQTPVDGLVIASDMDTILLGKLNKAYHGDHAAPAPAWQGPVGYVIE
jgi:pilus assembly protein CpaC